MSARVAWVGLALACAAGACGGRPSYWNAPVPASVPSYGLQNGVALVDDADHRVVLLTPSVGQKLVATSLPIGRQVATAAASADGKRLFVLSKGGPRGDGEDEQPPELTVIDAASAGEPSPPYDTSVPLQNLAVDPLGQWVVGYGTSGFVQNPNEIVFFDVSTSPPPPPVPLTVPSYGGTPQQLVFTPQMTLSDGQKHRLLVYETDIDVTLIDLDGVAGGHPPLATVRLNSGTSTDQVHPAGVAFDAGGARIALRAAGSRNVYALTLGAPADGSASLLTPTFNVADVGGVPSDIAFVHTDGGLRVAALVPSTSSAMLVDPDTGATTTVALPAPYSSLSLVTDAVGATTGADVAMLWNGNGDPGYGGAAGIALWTLHDTVGQPYFAVEVLGVSAPIAGVEDVAPGSTQKVLETADERAFYVLDLQTRTVSLLNTPSGNAAISPSPDGKRLWVFSPGGTELVAIDLATLAQVPLTTDSPISAVYDVEGPSGGRSLVAVHDQGAVGATVFDALDPNQATARRIPALLVEGP